MSTLKAYFLSASLLLASTAQAEQPKKTYVKENVSQGDAYEIVMLLRKYGFKSGTSYETDKSNGICQIVQCGENKDSLICAAPDYKGYSVRFQVTADGNDIVFLDLNNRRIEYTINNQTAVVSALKNTASKYCSPKPKP